jgi:hypothetical protein
MALGRTAFGDILVFRDLRERAAGRGLASALDACDVALIDLNLKKMVVLAWSVEEFFERLPDPAFQRAFLRKDLYDQVRARLGDPGDDETYAFVPALAAAARTPARSCGRTGRPTSSSSFSSNPGGFAGA